MSQPYENKKTWYVIVSGHGTALATMPYKKHAQQVQRNYPGSFIYPVSREDVFKGMDAVMKKVNHD